VSIDSPGRGYDPTMTVEEESDEPNEYGFAGGATAPEPERTTEPIEEVQGESIAVPAGDLTGAASNALDDITHAEDAQSDESR
jgi:hypothetical protein